jgi:hypothetical protein
LTTTVNVMLWFRLPDVAVHSAGSGSPIAADSPSTKILYVFCGFTAGIAYTCGVLIIPGGKNGAAKNRL